MVEERYSERGFPTIRVECKYDYDVLTVWRVYHNCEIRKKYDPLVGEISVVEQFGTNFCFVYQKTINLWVVSARDCKINCFYNIEPDGSISVLMYSNEDIVYP